MRAWHKIPSGMDRKIPKSGADRADRKKGEGVGPERMQGERRGDSGGARVERPRPPAGFSAAALVGEQAGPIHQRSDIEEVADGTQRDEPEILGETPLGEGLFRGEQRQRHGRGGCGIRSGAGSGSGKGRQF